MILNFTKKYAPPLLCLLLAVFLLSKMLLPGYVLTLDMAWSPEMPIVWSADGLNNSFPFWALVHVLTLIVPSWIVQKILLVGLFFLLFFIPYKFLPFVEGVYARAFAVGIFALNPFVYARMLSGQWLHLLAYTFLPLLLYSLIRLSQSPNRRSALVFFISLFLIGMFSIHFLYLACLLSAVYLSLNIVKAWWVGNMELLRAKQIIKWVLIAGAGFVLANLFWIIPAIMRDAPLEARFDETYFSAFSSAGNGAVPVMLNIAVLGGFWGEGVAWKYYFVWPQDHVAFLAVFMLIFLLILFGLWNLLKNPKTRFFSLVLFSIGVFAYVTSLGTAETPFKSFNLFLYQHIPFWGGLRDSHKIAGVLALVYAVFTGVGVSAFLSKVKKHSVGLESFASVAILVLPIIFGMYMWGGFHSQLKPVWYPSEWYEAKAVIDKMPAGEKVLVLPWHGYLSLDFAGNLVVANPTEAFFGHERVVSGRGVGFGGIRDQEVDERYRDIDGFLREVQSLSSEEISAGLKMRGVSTILIIVNQAIPHSEEGLTRWTQFSTENGDTSDDEEVKTWAEMLPVETTTILNTKSIILRKI